MKKKLILTVGCPGAGKTTWTNELCNKKIGETGVVSLDDLRTTIVPVNYLKDTLISFNSASEYIKNSKYKFKEVL